MFRISVGKPPYSTAWSNFVDSVPYSHDFDDIFNDKLSKFNARDIKLTEFVEFNTEEDALAFVLKFG